VSVVSISYARTLQHGSVITPSKAEAERIGAELKRWSQRPVGVTNARVLGLATVVLVMMLVAVRRTTEPASAVGGIAAMFAVLQGSIHFMSLGLLRGLQRAGVPEAQDAILALRNPRRLSNLDMAALWLFVALTARLWQ